VSQGKVLYGWAVAAQEHSAEGLVHIREGIAIQRAIGSAVAQTQWLILLADVYRMSGQPADGLAVVAEAVAVSEHSGEQVFMADLYRLQGELLQQAGDYGQQETERPASPEACFQHALDVSRQQQAKSFELRATMSQARLWQHQGKHQEAYDLLAPVYGWFTEGFDTADLQEAKALLETLA
jgi:predicted ATPase